METAISLRSLLPRCRFVGGEDLLVTDVVRDASQCRVGSVLAITSECEDPTAAACEAMARGAAGLIVENLQPFPLPQCIVADIDLAVSELMIALYGDPAKDLLIVGVIGGEGKTTTALLTAALLRGAGFRTAYETDLGCCDGVLQQVPHERQVDCFSMPLFLADARDSGAKVVVVELTENLLTRVASNQLPLDLVILTSGTQLSSRAIPAHLDTFADVTPFDLALQRLREGGVAIVNADSKAAMAAADRHGSPLLTYGMREEADVTAKVFDQQPGETTLMITAGDITAVMESKLTGPAMASCQLAAIAVGLLFETPLHKAIESVRGVGSVPGRMQRLSGFNQAAVILDRCGSARRLSAVLRGLRREKGAGRLWLIAGITEGFNADELAVCARIADRFTDEVIITSGQAGKDGFLATMHDWLDGVNKPQRTRCIADRETALQWALEHAGCHDTILVAGGWESGMPVLERATIDMEIERIESLRISIEAAKGNTAKDGPVILPHPALGKAA